MASAGMSAATAVYGAPKNAIPRWRGFNLLYYFQAMQWDGGPIKIPEEDFRMIADLGFDFVRIPMDYWFWSDPSWIKTTKLTAEGAT